MGSTYSALANLDDNDLILNQSENNNFVVRPEMIVSCSSDNTIVLNNMDTCNCVNRWKGHKREINKVLYKHSGSQHFVLSGSKDCSIRLWRFNETECIQTFNGHQFGVTGLATIGEDNFISGARDGKLLLWNIEQANQPICSSNISNNQNIITHIEVDNENKILFQTAEDGAIRFWDINNLSLIDSIPSSSGGHQPLWHCSRLANFESNGLLTAGGGDVNEIKDVRAAIFLQSQPQITSKRLMISVSNDKTIRLWDVNNGKCIWTENNITTELNCCADFTNGRVVVCGRNATLCELRLLAKAGRPFLRCISYQYIED
uniref:WD_REPEATS_REGION domain-containing protein n=1 Tax=Meloidogyne hapla TaxID=6305 RepID=A0A1I8BAV6_MELHA